MRNLLLGLATVVAVVVAVPDRMTTSLSPLVVSVEAQQPGEPSSSPASQPASPPAAQGQQQPDQRDRIDINVTQQPTSGPIWYRSPLWIAIGAIAVVLFAVIVIMMTRGGTGPVVIRHEH